MQKYIHCEKIRYFAAPMYKGLSIDLILKYMDSHNFSFDYLPDPQDIPKLPRQFILNVAFTVIQKPFADWVHNICNTRHHTMAEKKDLLIKLDPEVAKAFHQSQAISSKLSTSVLYHFCFPSLNL